MPVIPVVLADTELRQALRRGLPRRGVRVMNCTSVDRVAAVMQRELVDAVIVDVLRADAAGTFRLAASYPRIPFFALSAFRPDDGAMIAHCRRAGLRGVLVDSVDRPAAGELVASRTASRARRASLRDAPRLLRLTEPIQRRAWDEVFHRVGAPTTTSDVARALKRTREHLSREFAAGGAPNLKRVIDLARVVTAADLLGNPGYTVRSVARVLRFSSASHFAGAAHRIAGTTPVELGRLGPRGVFLRFLKGRTRSRI